MSTQFSYVGGVGGDANNPTYVGFADGPWLDAFARQRFSEPYTLYDSKQIWDDPDLDNDVENYPLFYDNQQISGGGTATAFNVNRASTILSVDTNTIGVRVRQSKQRFNYQPGKSQVGIFTNVNIAALAGNTKEIGMFDDNNGLFFRNVGGTQSVVVRSYVTGAAVDRVFEQALWNKDRMNGNIGISNPSGINLAFVKSQIPFIDFEWLGVGRVRYGWFIDGFPYYCHTVNNTNDLDSVYMSNPNLPIRCRIANSGTGAADSFEQICTTIISEGGKQPNGVYRFGDIGATTATDITAATPGTTYAICGIRLKQAYLSAEVRESFISVIETSGTNNAFLWKLHFNPTLTSGLTWADVAQSAVQFGTGAPAGDVITNPGHILAGGYQARTDASANVALESALRLGSTIAGVSDILVLSGTPTTNNQTYFGGMRWIESW